MIKKLDHVGMAVKNGEETLALLARLFGFAAGEVRLEQEAGFKSTLISRSGVTLELIEPVGPQGMIQRFIEKRGAGLHHISIQVDDLDEERTRLRALGVEFATEPAEMEDSRNVFLHPRSAGGLLIELVERPLKK